MAVNIIPASTVQPMRVPPGRGRFRGDFAGLDVAQLERELAASGRVQGEHQDLRELALLLGAGQQRNELGLMREQMAQQGEQFTESLDVQSEQFEAERGLRQQEVDRLGEELDFMREQYELAASLAQSQRDLEKATRMYDWGAKLGDLDVKERAEGAHRTVSTTLDSFTAGASYFTNIAASVTDDDTLERNLSDMEDAAASFIRNVKNTITDDNAPIDQRVGAAMALVAISPLDPGERLALPGVFLSELARLRTVAGKAERKRLDDLSKQMLDLGKLNFDAQRVIGAWNQSISDDPAKRAMMEQQAEAEERLATDLQRAQTEGGQLPIERPEFTMPARETGGIEEMLSALGERLETSSGNPLPNAKGGDLARQLEDVLTERETFTETVGEQAAAARERARVMPIIEYQQQRSTEEQGWVEQLRAQGKTPDEIERIILSRRPRRTAPVKGLPF